MPDQKESSVLFSLKELMTLEEDRIKQEEQEKRRVEEAALQARLDSERRSRDEEENRIRADEERKRTEEQRTREEAARVEAIRHAEIERARLDAENAARLEAMRHQHEHDRHITALTQDKGKKQLKVIAVSASVFLVLALVGGGIALKVSNDAQVAAQVKHKEELDALTSKLELESKNVQALQDAVQNAQDEGSRKAAKAALDAARKQREETEQRIKTQAGSGRGGGAKPANGNPAPKPNCNCPPGDPLCPCL